MNTVSMDLIKNVRSRKVDLPLSKAWAATSAAKKGPSPSDTPAAPVTATETEATDTVTSKDVQESPENVYARYIGIDTDKDPDSGKKIDFRGKTYLAPLTTVGNLPFRRICKQFGVDVTCGEMVLVNPLLQGQRQDWALLRRHPSEDLFGVQIAGGQAQAIGQTVEILSQHTTVDFIGKWIFLLCLASLTKM
jgi:tRNA-dihydrouridine synthase 3